MGVIILAKITIHTLSAASKGKLRDSLINLMTTLIPNLKYQGEVSWSSYPTITGKVYFWENAQIGINVYSGDSVGIKAASKDPIYTYTGSRSVAGVVCSIKQTLVDGVHTYSTRILVANTSLGILIVPLIGDGIQNNGAGLFLGKIKSEVQGKYYYVAGGLSKASYTYAMPNTDSNTSSYSPGSSSYTTDNASSLIFCEEGGDELIGGGLYTIAPYINNVPSGSVNIITPVYIELANVWSEPIRLDDFYLLSGMSYPDYFSAVTMGGLTLTRVTSRLAIV